MHRDRPVGLGRRSQQRVGVGDGEAHRLLHHDVLSGPEKLEGDRRVKDRRGGDDDDGDLIVGAQGLRVGVSPGVREVLGRRRASIGVGVAHRGESQPVGLGAGETVRVAHPAERPVADDARADAC